MQIGMYVGKYLLVLSLWRVQPGLHYTYHKVLLKTSTVLLIQKCICVDFSELCTVLLIQKCICVDFSELWQFCLFDSLTLLKMLPFPAQLKKACSSMIMIIFKLRERYLARLMLFSIFFFSQTNLFCATLSEISSVKSSNADSGLIPLQAFQTRQIYFSIHFSSKGLPTDIKYQIDVVKMLGELV